MSNLIEAQIVELEERLRLAMLSSDVAALSDLIAPELVFTSHLGQVMGREEDLAAHRSGSLDIKELVPSEQHIQIIGNVAIVTVRVYSTASYLGSELDGDFRFTRVWARSLDQPWRIVAAHCSAVM